MDTTNAMDGELFSVVTPAVSTSDGSVEFASATLFCTLTASMSALVSRPNRTVKL